MNILKAIGAILGTLDVIVTISMNLGPAWYPIVLAVLSPPSVWLGGKLGAR